MSYKIPHILILAAGRGKRMRSELPKVLHPVLFRPMLHWILETARSIPHQSISVVVGHEEAKVKEACKPFTEVQFYYQKEQRGTADAVMAAREAFENKKDGLIVLVGDVMLLKPNTLTELWEYHQKAEAKATVLTTELSDPTGYGRIIREGKRIVIREQADCSPSEASVKEINTGIYCFETDALFPALKSISTSNKQGEFYLTDSLEIIGKQQTVSSYFLKESTQALGINDRNALAEVEKILQRQTNQFFMRNGVTLQDPDSVWIDPQCRISSDVTIESGSRLIRSVIESNVTIEANCRIVDTTVGMASKIKQGSYLEGSLVGEACSVGPYAHLRPGSVLKRDVKIGNFVEIKKSTFDEGAKASHLSYIGDAEVGKEVNLGCGFITCNYDGKNKHKTIIKDRVFIGSDSQLVAPVTIEEGCYIASGSTITKSCPPDSLVFARTKQVTKQGYAKKYQK